MTVDVTTPGPCGRCGHPPSEHALNGCGHDGCGCDALVATKDVVAKL